MMKRSFLLLLSFLLLSGILYAQSVKQPTEDTAKYRANDRLKTAGPKDGWKGKSNTKIDSVKSKDTVATTRRTDSLKRKD